MQKLGFESADLGLLPLVCAVWLSSCSGTNPAGLFGAADAGSPEAGAEAAAALDDGTMSVETATRADALDATVDGQGSSVDSGSNRTPGNDSGSYGAAAEAGEAGTGDATTATSSPCSPSACPMVLLYMTSDGAMPVGRQASFRVKIFNAAFGAEPIDLTKITMRYWFLASGSRDWTFSCDYAWLDCATLSGKFIALATPSAHADTYLELTFRSGSVQSFSDSGEIFLRVMDRNYAVTIDQTKDWSFDATKTSYAPWDHITLYRSGALVWGNEPL